MRKIFLVILMCFSCIACTTLKISKQPEGAILAISAESFSMAGQGSGIIITLINIDTQDSIISQSLSSMSPHSVIQNIPPGRYYVRKILVPIGNIMYSNWSNEVRAFFGEIVIKPNSKYYLGNFNGSKKLGLHDSFRLTLNGQNIPTELKAKIENAGWKDGDFIKLYPNEKDALIVY